MAKYKYSYHEERGEFHAYVEDSNGFIIWEVHYPDLYEDEETGELVESSTIFEDGFVKSYDDVEGLEDYLKSIGVLKKGDELVDNDEYAKGGKLDSKTKKEIYQEWLRFKNGLKGGSPHRHIKTWTSLRGIELSDSEISQIIQEGKSKYADGGYFAKGGMTEHGLQIGDTIKKSQGFYIYVVNNNKNYLIDLNKGVRIDIEDDNKMASGGTLENKLKKKLTESFELPMEMAVYVPSTDKANIIISKRDYASRIEEVETFLSDLFGGYSAVSVDGGYVSDDKGLIQEDVTRVATFGSTENFESKFTKLINKVVDWCNKWGQESMGFEFEGDMFYIDKKASFKHGGQIITK